MNPTTIAIKACGTGKELASRLRVSPQLVSVWKKRGIPLRRIPDVSRVTGVPIRVLMPPEFVEKRQG